MTGTKVTEDQLRARLQQTLRALYDLGIERHVERSRHHAELDKIGALVGAINRDDVTAAVARMVTAARAYRAAHRRALALHHEAARSGVVLLDELGAALHIDTDLNQQTGGKRP